MTTDWRQILNASYRKVTFISQPNWTADVHRLKAQSLPIVEPLQSVIIPSPNGGPIAVIRSKLEGKTPCLKMYTSGMAEISMAAWPHVGLVTAGWADHSTFIAVFRDGTIRNFTIFGEKRAFFNCLPTSEVIYVSPPIIPAQNNKYTVLDACVTTKGILLILAGANNVHFNESLVDSKVVKLPVVYEARNLSKFKQTEAAGGGATTTITKQKDLSVADIKFVAVLNEDPLTIVALSSKGTVFQIGRTWWRIIELATNGSSAGESDLKPTKLILSPSLRFLAFASDDGFIGIANVTKLLGPNPKTTSTRSMASSLSITLNVVSAPAIILKSCTWLADHCLGLVVATPTQANPNQHCLFIGGPNSKWIDFVFPSWVVVTSEVDGLRFWQPSIGGMIHMVSDRTEAVLGPGACGPASMLCYALQQDNLTGDSWTIDETWNSASDSQARKLQEQHQLVDASNKFLRSDWKFLYYQTKWMEEPPSNREILMSDEVQEFLTGLTNDQINEAIVDLLEASTEEHDSASVINLLKAADLLLSRCEEPLAHRIRYLQICRDFKAIFRLRSNPSEIIMTYQEFHHLKLKELIRMLVRRRLYDVALDMLNQYRISELFEMESAYLKDCRFEPTRKAIRRNIFLIQKFLALDCVNVTISQDQNTVTLGDTELLEIVKAKIGEILFKDPSIARQAAWSAIKAGRHKFALSITENEPDPKVQMVLFQAVKDDALAVRRAIASGDSDILDVCLLGIVPSLGKTTGLKKNQIELELHGIHQALKKYTPPFPNGLISLISYVAAALRCIEPMVVEGQIYSAQQSFCRRIPRLMWFNVWSSLERFEMERAQQAEKYKSSSMGNDIPLNSGGQNTIQGKSLIGNLFTSPFTSLMNSEPSQSSERINPKTRQEQLEKSLEDLKNYRALSMISRHSRAESNPADALFVMDATEKHLGAELSDILGLQIELLRFQMMLVDKCRVQSSALGSIVGLRSAKTREKELLQAIPWETLTFNDTGMTLIRHSDQIAQGETLVEEFRVKFDVDRKVLLLWKLTVMAQEGHWTEFLDCAREAVRAGPLPKLDDSAVRPRTFTSAFSLMPSEELATQYSAYLKTRFGAMKSGPSSAATSAISATLSGLLAVIPGKSSSERFCPVFPEAMTSNAVESARICPNLMPPSSFAKLHLVDFVSVAKKYDRCDIASESISTLFISSVALIPYVNPPAVRERLGMHFGLRGPSEVQQFCKDAVEVALARTSVMGVGPGPTGMVMSMIRGARVVKDKGMLIPMDQHQQTLAE